MRRQGGGVSGRWNKARGAFRGDAGVRGASGAAAHAVDRGANVAPGRWLVSDEAAAVAPVPAPASKLLINAVPELGLCNKRISESPRLCAEARPVSQPAALRECMTDDRCKTDDR